MATKPKEAIDVLSRVRRVQRALEGLTTEQAIRVLRFALDEVQDEAQRRAGGTPPPPN